MAPNHQTSTDFQAHTTHPAHTQQLLDLEPQVADSDSDDNVDPMNTTLQDVSKHNASPHISKHPPPNDRRNHASQTTRARECTTGERLTNEKRPTTKIEHTPLQSADNDDDKVNDSSSTQNTLEDSNVTPDGTINVSKSCLDGVLQQMESRISELEQICARKKARVERLSCPTTMMTQGTQMQIWPQSAMEAAQTVLAQPAMAMALSTPITAHAAGATSQSGTPCLPALPPATGIMPAMMAAAAAAAPTVVAPPPTPTPPPPPPPPPMGADGERKQSRYWTPDEHERFLAAVKTCGPKNYVRIAELVGTRNAKQVRTHAQKFQKRLEREEAKRRDDLQRHGGAVAAASSVSAAAVAAVAAAAAAMHHGSARHMTAESTAAVAYPHMLLQYAQGAAPGPSLPNRAPLFGGGVPPSGDGSSSTNDVSNDHQRTLNAATLAEAAVAAEASALGNRVYSAPVIAAVANGVEAGGSASANQVKNNNGVIPTPSIDDVAQNTNSATPVALAASNGDIQKTSGGGEDSKITQGATSAAPPNRRADAAHMQPKTTGAVS